MCHKAPRMDLERRWRGNSAKEREAMILHGEKKMKTPLGSKGIKFLLQRER